MADLDLTQEIRALRSTFSDIQQVVDVAKLSQEVEILKQQAADPNIWDEPVHAQSVTSKLSHAQAMIAKLESVQSRLDDLEVLIEMANAEADSTVQSEAKSELAGLQKLISELEVQTLLNGEYDSRAAVVTIRSGAGGDDAELSFWTHHDAGQSTFVGVGAPLRFGPLVLLGQDTEQLG